ncbi:hypothetical protein IAD21_02724 [Abditibacteriota bacterium]|nr:hypothetical protein IAD21_02724 [Abditibacteriota bacterium]
MFALLVSIFVYALALALAWFVEGDKPRKFVSSALLPVALGAMLTAGQLFSPVERLVLSTILLLGLVKCAVALRRSRADVRSFSRLGLALYFFVWPGANMAPFKTRATPSEDEAERRPLARALFGGATCAVLGVASLLALGWFAGSLSAQFLGWATIFALLLTVHFGVGEMLPWAVQQLGFRVGALFRAPLASESLPDFWSRRWNLAFVEMNSLLFLRPLRKRFGATGAIFGTFVLSGLFHEIALSYPGGGGWGGPMLYFLLHGALCVFVAPRLAGIANRVLAWVAILLPLPLLFHNPVREVLVVPLDFWLSGLLHTRSFDWWFSLCLWLGSIGHFCILGASFQVPKRLGWHEDLPKLSRFNRKVFWTYGAFIVLCIVSFGILTLMLHGELLRGDKAAVALSMFIGVFWAARVGTDLFYFKHDDWPRGWEFEFGHVALTFLFSCLTVLFGIVVPLHALWLGYLRA